MRALVVALVLGCASTAAAQTGVPMEHEGRPGVWVELTYARELAALVLEEPHQVERLRLLDERLQLREVERITLRAAVDEARDQLAARALEVEALEARIASLEQWWNLPWFWGPVGFVVGLAIPLIVWASTS